MNQHQLLFTMPLGKSQRLITGTLKLIYPDGQEIDYLATSGLPDWQRPTDQWVRGKCPIPQGGDYQIPAEPYLVETRGVEELGIHFDANVPGTSGCIELMNWEGWEGFCRRMRNIAALGVEFLPLKVQY
jgi:hypothetical protein